MRDAKLRTFDLRSFRVGDDFGCYVDRFVDYSRPALCCDPFCCVGAESQLHLLVNNPGLDAFACIGTFYAQHAPRIVAEHEVPIGHRVSSQALSKACSIARPTSRCVAVSSVSRFFFRVRSPRPLLA